MNQEKISKTKLKQHMTELQDLGMELVKLSRSQLAKLQLSEELIDALQFAKTINSNSALRRHNQYIGKLMRKVDSVKVRENLSFVLGESVANTRILHASEKWRERLLANDDELAGFFADYPPDDKHTIAELSQLVALVRKEILLKQNINSRKLFKYIRELVELKERAEQ